jgi:hypothetical protein
VGNRSGVKKTPNILIYKEKIGLEVFELVYFLKDRPLRNGTDDLSVASKAQYLASFEVVTKK